MKLSTIKRLTAWLEKNYSKTEHLTLDEAVTVLLNRFDEVTNWYERLSPEAQKKVVNVCAEQLKIG